jgi:hypothetical protein
MIRKASSQFLHICSRFDMAFEKIFSTIGFGGTVLASLRWIFELNASGTLLPSACVF